MVAGTHDGCNAGLVVPTNVAGVVHSNCPAPQGKLPGTGQFFNRQTVIIEFISHGRFFSIGADFNDRSDRKMIGRDLRGRHLMNRDGS